MPQKRELEREEILAQLRVAAKQNELAAFLDLIVVSSKYEGTDSPLLVSILASAKAELNKNGKLDESIKLLKVYREGLHYNNVSIRFVTLIIRIRLFFRTIVAWFQNIPNWFRSS
jgi:hypothetical protein